MKFVHAADVHLDSPLRGLERYDTAPAEAIRGATRYALDNLVRLCLDEAVELLVISGDLYDGDWKDYNTGLFFIDRMARLAREGIDVILIRGNHDAASQLTRHLRYPPGVRELSTRKPETVVLEKSGVAVHGRGYPKREVSDDLSAGYPEPLADFFNVGLLHTALDGRPGHASYAPCSLQSLVNKGYQYWALGHVHAREVLARDPWIVFPGNLQGRHARETGPKGATLVEVEDGVVRRVEHRPLDTVRWSALAIDAGPAASGHDLVELAREALAAEAAADRLTAVRLTLGGRSRAHRDLMADPERWSAELRAAVADLDAEVWLEKIRFDTRTVMDLERLREGDDPLAALLQSLRRLRQNPEALAELGEEFADLRQRLPPEYRELEDALDLENPETLMALLEETEQSLIPRLLEAGERE